MLHGDGIALTVMMKNIFHLCMVLLPSSKYLLTAGGGNIASSLLKERCYA